MFHKVSSVRPLPQHRLSVMFDGGERRLYDVTPLFKKWDAFKALESVSGLFEQVKVDAGGYGISWNDELDLSCEELYERGERTEIRSQPK
ncbi:MAG: DUF2442 domain-containing protein [Treponema sp.]|nr:DUF2442 domain-containing protein [Treponema sp.]